MDFPSALVFVLEKERALGSRMTTSIPIPAALTLKFTFLSLIDSHSFSDTACRFSGAERTTIVYLSRKEHSSVRADRSSRQLYQGAKHDHGTDLFNRRTRATAHLPALLSLYPGTFWCRGGHFESWRIVLERKISAHILSFTIKNGCYI